MADQNTQKLEERIRFLQKEAEAFKRQSYEQADLLLDLVPPLSRLGHAGNSTVVDAALGLARGIGKNSQDVDAIRTLADEFLAVYKKANEAGKLLPYDTGWRSELADTLSKLPADPHLMHLLSQRVREGGSLPDALAPLAEVLQGESESCLDINTRERLAEMISALPLEKLELLQASKLSSRLRGENVDLQELDRILDELASLLEHALQSTINRDQQMQRLVTQMSGELSVVEGFLGALNQRDDDSLAEAVAVQVDVDEQSEDMVSALDGSDSLPEIKQQVLIRAQSIRARMDKYAADARVQREAAAKDTAELAQRLQGLESELENTREALAEARETASHDFLTGLYNRQAFEDAMKTWLPEAREGGALCCIIWDVDHFKKVNDSYGHIVGDRVLKAVSKLLDERVGEDDMAARLGGEEFVTVIRGAQAEAVLDWADDVRQQVAALQHDADSQTIQVSVSCGIAVYQRGDSLVSILARADKALYGAKDQGRNRCLLAA